MPKVSEVNPVKKAISDGMVPMRPSRSADAFDPTMERKVRVVPSSAISVDDVTRRRK